jgi:hypothetical protein
MTNEELSIFLYQLAETHEQYIASTLPLHALAGIALFIETVRTSDVLFLSNTSNNLVAEKLAMNDIVGMGWNLAASYLLRPIEVKGFPMRKSDEEMRQIAGSVMFNFGCCTQLRRTADMVRAGFLEAEIAGNTFTFRKKSFVDDQHEDELEYIRIASLEKQILAGNLNYEDWRILETENPEDVMDLPGASIGISAKNKFSGYLRENVEELMLPLLKPWNSGHGLMISYETTPEIDGHFMALATEIVKEWVIDAGIHPEMQIGALTGVDLRWVVLLIVSFDLKHIKFLELGVKKMPSFSLGQSATTWHITDEVIDEITAFTAFDRATVKNVLDLILFRPDDAGLLKRHSSLFMPLLVDLGNGYVLRPVSGVRRNPFYSIIAALEHRNPNFRHDISLPREKWQRDELYAQFQGDRYQRTDGNVNLKKAGKIITDIDAAVFDNTTGELALFQIKWQDFFFNDVKKLRSKASNLVRELEEWAEKTNSWVSDNGLTDLQRLLRIKTADGQRVRAVYLFGLSRNAGRTSGYGFEIKSDDLAVTNWAQFRRYRIEIGPAKHVISGLFEKLKKQEDIKFNYKPIPLQIQVQDQTLIFKDMWYYEDEKMQPGVS